jgi:hypothetical protein
MTTYMLNESSSFRLTQPGAGFKYRATLEVFLVEMIFRSASVLELLCFSLLRHSKALEGFKENFQFMKDVVEDVVVYIPSCTMMYIYLSTLLVQIISVFCFVAADVLWDQEANFLCMATEMSSVTE